MHIYCYRTTATNKRYVGQTIGTDLRRYRMNDISRAVKGSNRKPHLYAAMRKHGPDTFSIESLVEINSPDLAYGKKQLDCLEQFYIRLYETQDKNKGYNIAAGGGGSFGYTKVVSEETRKKIAEANRNRKHSEETKAKIRDSHKGVPKSAEHRAKLSAARMGKKTGPFTEEHKRNMALAQIGKKHSPERVERMRQSLIKYYEQKQAGGQT